MQALVLGGGVAGLAAALAVRQAGWEAIVVERRSADAPATKGDHVHRLAAQVISRLVYLTGEAVSTGDARTAVAAAGELAWGASQSLTTLGRIEAALAAAAGSAGVELIFEESIGRLAAVQGRWVAETDARRELQADLVIDASGAGRVVFSLLGDEGPAARLDEVGRPERHASWVGLSEPGDPVLIAWRQAALEGLLQVGGDGHTALTARTCLEGDLSLSGVTAAMALAGGRELERRVAAAGLSGRGLSHLTHGARRVALEQADLMAWPPFALVGDALIQAPPRYGEGVGRALEHADWLQARLMDGGWRDCGAVLARRSAANWAGYGVAATLSAA